MLGMEQLINQPKEVSALGKKRDVAKMLNQSLRSVDNHIANGCPVIKSSPRCCRFDMAEVMAWYKAKYGQQSRRSLASN
jgi:phage terminase Nu1 subunit (DNA packaging protein)